MVSYLIRTRNRPHRVQRLLRDIARTHGGAGVREVIVVDDASQQRLVCPSRLGNGLPLRAVWTDEREGWASLNHGANIGDARSEWLVFLHDDACPVNDEYVGWLGDWDPSVAAVAPDVFVDAHGACEARRVSASLPETLPACAFAVRRAAFLRAGGFSRDLAGPGAVVDLCARVMVRGRSASRVVFDPRWIVARRAGGTRGVSRESLLRQVRDYAFALACHAPESARGDLLHCVDDCMTARSKGARKVLATVLRESRSMALGGGTGASPVWDRLTGLHAVRETLAREQETRPFRTAALVEPGRHAWVVVRVLEELGVDVVDATAKPDVLVVATLSPGAMLGAMFRHARGRGRRVLAPWAPPVPVRVTPRPAIAA